MTPEQYDDAVEALAVLIGRWPRHHPDPCPDCTDSEPEGDMVAT